MSGLLLEHYPMEALDGSTGPSGLYVLVFNEQHQALQVDSPNHWAFASFLETDQNAAGIVILQHAQRTNYFYRQLAAGQLNMAATGYGEQYTVEVWEHIGTGNFNRGTDVLHDVLRFPWAGTRKVHAQLDSNQEQVICCVSAGYNPSTQVATFLVWLEKNGQHVTTPTNCTLHWKDRSGVDITNTTNSSPNADGVFVFQVAAISLTADIVTPALVSVTDSDSSVYSTQASFNAWD